MIVLQAADHELGKNNDSGASDSSATVNHNRRLRVLRGVQHAVSVTTHRLDLLEVGYSEESVKTDQKEELGGSRTV